MIYCLQSARRPSSGMTSLAAIFIATTLASEICGVQITKFDMPSVIRNGTGPVDLQCVYNVEENENGLVIKWFHPEQDLIYQWIPPMAPQDEGVFKGLAEYPAEAVNQPMTHSIIRVKEVTLEMSGEYTCSISTFQDEARRTTRMIVYVPESNITIYTPMHDDNHVNLTCVAIGAHPRPVLILHVEGVEVNGHSRLFDKYPNEPWISHQAIIEEPQIPSLVECEIVIPHTDYRRRVKMVYYPRSHRSSTVSRNVDVVTRTENPQSTTTAPKLHC